MRRNAQNKVYDLHRKSNCNQKDEQRSNLSERENEGLRSLRKKIAEKNIIVMKTDKSSRFVITNEEEYKRMGRSHTDKDRKINRKQL
jgi:hypothetical protein